MPNQQYIKVISLEILKFPRQLPLAASFQNPVKWSFAGQGGCYPLHRAPFNIRRTLKYEM